MVKNARYLHVPEDEFLAFGWVTWIAVEEFEFDFFPDFLIAQSSVDHPVLKFTSSCLWIKRDIISR